jgi:hypothetical protein
MSALEVMYPCGGSSSHLHVVVDGETSAHHRRQEYSRLMSRAYLQTRGQILAELTLACAVMATITWAMVVGFLSVPNTPLP